MSGGFTFTPTEAQLYSAYKLYWPTGLTWKLLIFIVILSLATALTIVRPGPQRMQDIAIITTCASIAGAVVGLVIQWLTTKFWIPLFSRRIYRQQADLKLETRFEWDQEGFRAINSDGEGLNRWAAFHQWKRNSEMLLLYRSEVLFNFIPLSSPGSQNDGDEIVAFLRAANVPERRK